MNPFSYTFTMITLAGCMLLVSCGSSKTKNGATDDTQNTVNVQVPAFNADSAYAYIQKQTEFGPRVPNTKAHKDCGEYLAKMLESFGAEVHNQYANLAAYDGTILESRNIIGVYNPETKKRVLLCAHWDSRPYADEDDQKYHHTPIDGANDGASGVGVLLEIARQIKQQAPGIGIDIVFFDSEDYGIPSFHQGNYIQDTWCLGAQYWGKRPHTPDYKARFGILLDMVGGKNAKFYYEGYSMRTANHVMKKIWDAAHQLGYSDLFIKQVGGEMTDDHLYVNRLRKIPCVDIIDFDPNTQKGFNPTWHTISDNMENIDKAVLQAVGQTVLHVIYNEK